MHSVDQHDVAASRRPRHNTTPEGSGHRADSRLRPARVRDALAAGRSVVVHGDAGTGKTHLINEALRGGLPQRGRLIDLTPTTGTASWQQLVNEASRRGGATDAAAALWDWMALPPGGTALLRLEDAQLLDDAILDAVVMVSNRVGVTLVATHNADPSEASFFAGLRNVETSHLPVMNAAQTEALLTELLGGAPTADAVHRLWLAARGNPFYLCELIRDQFQRGELFARDGVWVWTGTPRLTDRMIETAFHDLAGLGAAEREVVERAAVVGSVPATAVDDDVRRRLLRRGLLRSGRAGKGVGTAIHLEVTHPLRADAIAAQVSATRRHHLMTSGQPESARIGPHDLVRSVSRRVRAEIEVPLPELLSACHQAVREDEPQTAVELISTLLQRGVDPVDTIRALTARARAHLRLGDIDAALTDLASARSAMILAEDSGEEVLAAYLPAIRTEATARHFVATDTEATLEMLDSTARWMRPTAQTNEVVAQALTSVEALRLAHLAWAGRHHEMVDEAWVRLRESPYLEQVVQLVGPAAIALALTGRARAAHGLFRRFLPVIASDRVLQGWDPGSFTLLRFFLLVLTGDTDAAERTEPMAGVDIDMVGLHLRRGTVASARGDWVAARRELRAASVRLRVRDTLGVVAYSLAQEAKVAAAAGDAGAARALLGELATTPRRCSHVTGAYLDLHVIDTLLWLRDPSAAEVAADLAAAAARDGQFAVELEALHRLVLAAGSSAAQAASGVPLADRVAQLASQVDGRRNEAVVAHLSALLVNSTHAADHAAEQLRECGVVLPATVEPTRLTRREREVAVLAAGGMTSKAIAQRLVLSNRTVDSHLASAYRKLKVHSRERLSEALAATVE